MTYCRTCLSVPCECPHAQPCVCARCVPREPWARLEPPAPVQPAPAAFCSQLEVEDDGPARVSPLTWVARMLVVWLFVIILGASMC